MSFRSIRLFLRLSRFILLLPAIVLYWLGLSIAAFNGHSIDPLIAAIGLFIVLLLQLMSIYLNEYYDYFGDAQNQNKTLLTGGSGALGAENLPPRVALYAGIATITILATISTILLSTLQVPVIGWLLILIGFFFGVSLSAPPIRWIESGYGEILAAVVAAGLVPSLAYVLQSGDFDRILPLAITPLVALYFSMLVMFELPDYASDLQIDKRTLMVRIGWERGMRMHNVAIGFAILTMAIAALNGLPRQVVLGVLIALPLALGQIWQLNRVQAGYRPRWLMLVFTSFGLVMLTTYLEIAGFLQS